MMGSNLRGAAGHITGCWALSLLAAVAGCAMPSYTSVRRFSIDPQTHVEAAEPTGRSLGIRTLDYVRLYDKAMVHHDTNYEVGFYDASEWAELPRDTVTRALKDAIVATGRFADVGNATDLRAPDLMLIGQLRRFDEVREGHTRVAACEVHLELRDGTTREAIWAATLSARDTLSEKGPEGLAAAMSRAVSRIAEEAAQETSKY